MLLKKLKTVCYFNTYYQRAGRIRRRANKLVKGYLIKFGAVYNNKKGCEHHRAYIDN